MNDSSGEPGAMPGIDRQRIPGMTLAGMLPVTGGAPSKMTISKSSPPDGREAVDAAATGRAGAPAISRSFTGDRKVALS